MSKSFEEVFEIELKCWCYGLERVDEVVDASVLHKVIKEFSPVLKEAIQNKYEFSIVDVATRFVTAAKCKQLLREIVYYLSSHLPAPFELKEEEKEILNKIISTAELKYQGINKRYSQKWSDVGTPINNQSLDTLSLDTLNFPPKPSRAS